MPNSKCCDFCKNVPAGISKRTGKAYESFWACQNSDCPNYKPPRNSSGGFEKINVQVQPNAFQEEVMERFDDLRQRLIDLQRTINEK